MPAHNIKAEDVSEAVSSVLLNIAGPGVKVECRYYAFSI